MTNPVKNPTPAASHRGAARLLAMLGAVALIALTLYASNDSLPLAAEEEPQAAVPADAVAAANAFLDSLDDKQREKAVYDFASPKKPNWSNLPISAVPRNGVRMGDMTNPQRTKAMRVVAAVLSKGGYQKMVDIMDGDQKLAEGGPKGGKGGKDGKDGKDGKGGKGGGKGGAMFGLDNYFLAFFGKPSTTEPWMVQFGGHHLGLNVTVVGKTFVIVPTHTGAQPTLYKRDGKDVRPLGQENDTAFKLVNALDDKQKAQAILSDRPQGELLLGPGRDGRTIEPQGVKGSALNADQQAMLLDVVAAWVDIAEPGTAKARLAEIKEKIGDTYFAWKGPTTNGSAAYFRIQGPTIVIEYAPQGGTDHIHTVVRNPKDDYGAGLMKK